MLQCCFYTDSSYDSIECLAVMPDTRLLGVVAESLPPINVTAKDDAYDEGSYLPQEYFQLLGLQHHPTSI